MSERSSIPVVSRWLCPGTKTFVEVASMVVTWWIVACLCSVITHKETNMIFQYLYTFSIRRVFKTNCDIVVVFGLI